MKTLFLSQGRKFLHANTKSSGNVVDSILEASLEHVHVAGWSDESIIRGIHHLGLSPMMYTSIEGGSLSLVHYFLRKKRDFVRTQMLARLSSPPSTNPDYIYETICHHLDYMKSYRNTWPSAVAQLVESGPRSFPLMIDITDDICEFSDIRAARLDWYSERALLVSVYGLTELYMLTDESDDLADTKDFLKRSLETYHSIRAAPSGAGSLHGIVTNIVTKMMMKS